MFFWVMIMVIAIVSVSWWGIAEIVKIGTRYSENVHRIKNGYPTLNGDTPNRLRAAKDAGYIDMTEADGDRYSSNNSN